MKNPRILLIEDCPTDALIVKHSLRKHFDVDHVDQSEGRAASGFSPASPTRPW